MNYRKPPEKVPHVSLSKEDRMSNIEWTEQTWNPTTGCDRISPGCDNCYALTMAKRLKGMGSAKYQTDGDPRTSGPGFGLAVHPDVLTEPLRWKKPRKVFVNSMSDLFHARVPVDFITDVWRTMQATPQHTYQILTKRAARLPRVLDQVHERLDLDEPLPNVWLGTSIESDDYARRATALRHSLAAVRFVSAEPLLDPLPSLDLDGIDWVIIGGESGHGARPFQPQWAVDLIGQARQAGAAPFVKQLGSVWAREHQASDGKGGKPADWPEALRVREYPKTAVPVGAAR
jgi:protein gp37